MYIKREKYLGKMHSIYGVGRSIVIFLCKGEPYDKDISDRWNNFCK